MARKTAEHIELDVNGVGYLVFVSDRTHARRGVDQPVTLRNDQTRETFTAVVTGRREATIRNHANGRGAAQTARAEAPTR